MEGLFTLGMCSSYVPSPSGSCVCVYVAKRTHKNTNGDPGSRIYRENLWKKFHPLPPCLLFGHAMAEGRKISLLRDITSLIASQSRRTFISECFEK